VSNEHAQNYYSSPTPAMPTGAGPVQAWTLPADTISGPLARPGAGTNAAGNFAGLCEMQPNDLVNNGNFGPIPPGDGVIPTI
jgi:hypothetical protein